MERFCGKKPSEIHFPLGEGRTVFQMGGTHPEKEMENTFKAIASDVNKSNTEDFFKLANDKFQNLSKESDTNLEQKKKLIDQNLEEMSKKLDSIQKQSNQLNANLEINKTETENLRDTTAKLREILSSSQKRGQWGERMVEDILKFIGLMDNVNYKKQIPSLKELVFNCLFHFCFYFLVILLTIFLNNRIFCL